MIGARNRAIAPFKLEYKITNALTTGPIQASALEGHGGNHFDNGVLFFLAADVCETKPGDCLVDFEESDLWRAEARTAGGPYHLIAPGKGTSFKGISPGSNTNPSINDLDPMFFPGKCNRRIVLGDFTADISTLNPASFKAWGAFQKIRIYDSEGNESTMRHRFGVYTRTTAPYDVKTFISRGSSDDVSGNEGRCCE
jgi:hypothetical protein